ncbi:DUF3006 domain-containing protein [Oscillospiraceae bacterium PP1C4]
MRFIIDRFEEGFAVCEDETGMMQTLARTLLPADAAAGDVLVFADGMWRIDAQETAGRRASIQKKLACLWED